MESKVISIFSNKGGVGKTFFSVNFATALALSGSKVLLLDLDIQAGQDMARMLNLTAERSLADGISEIQGTDKPGLDSLKKFVITHSSGVDFLSAITSPQQIGKLSPEDVKTFLKIAAPNYDYIIIDLGYSFSEIVLTALDHSNAILLVATPDILAVYQTKWCIKILQSMHFPLPMIKLVLNRSESQGGVAWQEVREALGIDIICRIPSDGKGVGVALEHGAPYVLDNPRGPLSDVFRKIVNDIKKGSLAFHTAGPSESQQKSEESVAPAPGSPELIALKKKIHAKLIEKLNLASITPEHFDDPIKALELREAAKKIVSSLLLEEKGAIIPSHEERLRTINEIVNEILGLGVLEEIMRDPDVTDIMINCHDEIYVEKKGQLLLTENRYVSDEQLRAIINRIVAPLGRRIDESVPMVDARLPNGSRFHAIIPPLCLTGPCVTIRKFGAEQLSPNDIIHKVNSLSQAMHDFLYACVLGRMNIIISGGTGSGKTTLLNILSEYVPDGERIVTIEDAAELRLKKEHWVRLESRPANVEGIGEVTVRDLFVNSLRMRPDRIVVGECRGAEVLDMLQAMNTGHDGSMTTMHANSTRDVLIRMSSMILLSGIELPMRAINEMISSAINIIVHMARYIDGSRKITGITEVAGITDQHELILKDIFQFHQTGRDVSGKVQGLYQPCNYIPQCAEALLMKGVKLDTGIFQSAPAQG